MKEDGLWELWNQFSFCYKQIMDWLLHILIIFYKYVIITLKVMKSVKLFWYMTLNQNFGWSKQNHNKL